MSPEPAGAIVDTTRSILPALPCARARCPLAAGCDRTRSRGGRAVLCPVLGYGRVALAPFVPVQRGKARRGLEGSPA